MVHLTVEMIPDPELGGFTARVPDIPAYGEGATEDEALGDLREALQTTAVPGRSGEGAADSAPPAPSDPAGGQFPNIFVAVRKQLGLRLAKVADVPADVIVIESVDKLPTEN